MRRQGGGGSGSSCPVTNCTHTDRVRAADALEAPCRRSWVKNCRPWWWHRYNQRRGSGNSSGIETPGWSALGETTHYLPTPPRLHWQFLPLFFVTHFNLHRWPRGSAESLLRLLQSLLPKLPSCFVWWGAGAVLQRCCPTVEWLFAKSTGLDKVLVDVPVPSPDPDPDVSGMWVGSARGPKDQTTNRSCDLNQCCLSDPWKSPRYT